MAEISQTPAAAQQSALQKIQARENAIRANGIKQGRDLERKAICEQLGVQQIEEASMLGIIAAERDARPTPSEEAKHVRGALGWGALWGAIGGFTLAALAFTWIIDQNTRMAFERAQEATQQGALVGAAAANQDPANRGHDTPHLTNAPAP